MCEPMRCGERVRIDGGFFGGCCGVVSRVIRTAQGLWLVTVLMDDGRSITRFAENVELLK